MKHMKKLWAAVLATPVATAHCPLCTAGAAIAAGGAMYLGVKAGPIGVFIGAFAASMAWWIDGRLKKYIPLQKWVLILVSWLLTVLPLNPLLRTNEPIMIAWIGEYGSLLNSTYTINTFLVGAVLGGIAVCVTPSISRRITSWRGRHIAYQGIILTFVLLMLLSVWLQW